MPNTRDLRRRIKSIRNTEQLTRAMKMVAAARLRRSQEQILAARPYARAMGEVLARLAARTDAAQHPLLAERGDEKIELIVMTGDRGMCGSFNASILREATDFLAKNKDKKVSLRLIGRKGSDFFKRQEWPITASYTDVFKDFNFESAREIGRDLITRFIDGDLDAVYLVYNEFKSAISQEVVVQKLLPLPRIEPEPGEGDEDYLYEPDPASLFDELLPRDVNVQVWASMLESNAAENGARMAAMDAASKNAAELIDKLTLQLNRIRQASITTEIIEVVSGAEAL